VSLQLLEAEGLPYHRDVDQRRGFFFAKTETLTKSP